MVKHSFRKSNARLKSLAGKSKKRGTSKVDPTTKQSKVDTWVSAVQRKKEAIFQKRQEELKAKLQVKEAKRQMLSGSKCSYTPKLDKSTPKKYVQQSQDQYSPGSPQYVRYEITDRTHETK